MIRQRRVSLFLSGAAAAALALGSATAQADVLAKDSYITGAGEYSPGGLSGQSSASAVGFANPWSVSSANLQVEAGGILDGSADPNDGQGKFISAPGQFSQFFRSARQDLDPQVDPPNNTFYMSHLVNAGTSTGPNQDYAFVGFGDFTAQATIEGTANFLGGAFVGYVGSATNPSGVDLVIRSRTGAAAGSVSDALLVSDAENITFNVVMALEYNNPGDQVRWWINPTDFANGEAGLTASAASAGTIPGFQLGAASSMNDLTVVTNGFDRSFFWDESILASSVGALAGIPEPTSAVLALVGVLGAIGCRRR